MNTVSPADLEKVFTANKEHIFSFCCAPTETLAEWTETWGELLTKNFVEWLQQQTKGQQSQKKLWGSYSEGWTDFVNSREGTLEVTLACDCRPHSTCKKCGPVKGKVRGVVYLQRISNDEYLISS